MKISYLTPVLLMLLGCHPQTPNPNMQSPTAVPEQSTSQPATAEGTTPAAANPSEQAMPRDLKTLPVANEGTREELAARYAEIQALIGDAKASDVQQCRRVAFGYKACGGPASYLIYSVQGLDETLLLKKVSEYNALDQAEAQRTGLMSNCAMVLEPSVVLVEGVCKAGPAGEFLLR